VAIAQWRVWGLSAPLIACAAAGPLLLAAFIWREAKAPAPLIDLRLFRSPAFSAGCVGVLVSFAMLYGMFFAMSFVLIRGYYDPAFAAGLRLTIIPVALGLVAPFGGAWSDKRAAPRDGWRHGDLHRFGGGANEVASRNGAEPHQRDGGAWVGVDCHPGQRPPRTQLEKGACAALHAASEAIGPLDSMRHLRRQLVEPGLDIDHTRAVDSALQIDALMSSGKYDVVPKAQMTQEETLATSIF
jgi:hypothetical protein